MAGLRKLRLVLSPVDDRRYRVTTDRFQEEDQERTKIHDYTFIFYNHHGGNLKQNEDPRNDSSQFPIELSQPIYSTTNSNVSSDDNLHVNPTTSSDKYEYRAELKLELSKKQCIAIHKKWRQDREPDVVRRAEKKGYTVGFRYDKKSKNWMFAVPVNICCRCPDLRLRWKIEVPLTEDCEAADELVERGETRYVSSSVDFSTPWSGIGLGDGDNQENMVTG